ncbi:MAG: sigma-70 family RNA polymerase sigma factor [Deltaproteobacteria bacterium]|nr:sigma-70 family RNA polymerase sigma factor [Deltaproteobacteria bacterium]
MQRYDRRTALRGEPSRVASDATLAGLDETHVSLHLAMAPDAEEAAVCSAGRGDEAARAWIVRTYTPLVHRFSLRMLGNEEDARDATQETMVKVLRHLDRYDPSRRFATWVFGIARNTCIDEHRRRLRRRTSPEVETVDPADGAFERTEREQRAARLLAALQRLPPRYREILLLYHFELLKYREIADILHLPLGTVMNRIFRARSRLRELYLALEPETGVRP